MKKKLLAVIMSVFCLTATIPCTSVLADGQKVVTLGADLSAEQKEMILRYFGISGQNIQTLTITNQDERDHLGSYVPLEQIGTRTYSCALVNPTASGGIQVKTANLSWVTSNMIATTLSTSGVVNCEVLAAAPFEVSGTGALTGILMAYESAVGTTLDIEKKEAATQELITTTTIANTLGQALATDLVNESKKQIIEGNVVSNTDINIVIDEVAAEEGISLTDEDRQLLVDLMEQIADLDYNYDDMKETLERVEANMKEIQEDEEDDDELISDEDLDFDEETAETPEAASDGSQTIDGAVVIGDSDEDEADEDDFWDDEDEDEDANDDDDESGLLDTDSILMNTDESVFGDSTIFDATDTAALGSSDNEDDDTAEDDEFWDDEDDDDNDADFWNDEDADDNDADFWDDETVVEPSNPAEAPTSEPTPETPTDVTSDIPEEGMGTAHLNLELIPLTDMKLSPITEEANAYQVFQADINELIIDVARADVLGGSGTLTLYQAADSSIVEAINMCDEKKVAVSPLSEELLAEYGWTQGSRVVVTLSERLAPLTAYYVMLSEDAVQTADGIGMSEATPDSYYWTINTGEYGFYIDDTAEGIKAGTQASGQITMESDLAAYARIEQTDPEMVTFDTTEFTASGSFTASFSQTGKTSFIVAFYDEADTCLYALNYEVTVADSEE